jgi:hypothetical protein
MRLKISAHPSTEEVAMPAVRRPLLFGIAVAAVGVGIGIGAPTAAADCTNAGATTVCAQGTVTGGSGGPGAGAPPQTGPYFPYPCEFDWYCGNAGSLSIINDQAQAGIVWGNGGPL